MATTPPEPPVEIPLPNPAPPLEQPIDPEAVTDPLETPQPMG